jgi:mitochondrial fission protein ELM1
MSKRICWVITDGSAGMENQAWGLAEKLGFEVVLKRIFLKKPWLYLSPYFRLFKKYSFYYQDNTNSSTLLSPSWPDLVVACGRKSILPALYVKEEGGNKTKLVYLQDPKISTKHFDVVICPEHDKLTGENVIKMHGAPHRVKQDQLDKAKMEFEEIFYKHDFKDDSDTPESNPRTHKRIGVLLGGPNRVYDFGAKEAEIIANQLLVLQKLESSTLIITPSRRTSQDAMEVFNQKFRGKKNIYFWNRKGLNPYFGILALTDAIILTCDSISMASEVAYTDKNMYFLKLPGGSKKFNNYHNYLFLKKRASWLEIKGKMKVDYSRNNSLNEEDELIKKLQQMLKLSQ